jgi:hypothetical protein
MEADRSGGGQVDRFGTTCPGGNRLSGHELNSFTFEGTDPGYISGSPGMNVGRDLLIGLKAFVSQGVRGSRGLLGGAHVW